MKETILQRLLNNLRLYNGEMTRPSPPVEAPVGYQGIWMGPPEPPLGWHSLFDRLHETRKESQ